MSSRRIGLLAVLVACLLAMVLGLALAWQQSHRSYSTTASTISASTPTAIATTPTNVTAGECHSVNELPDPTCTPGVADPRVTQDNIHTTICVSGYTTRVRPSSTYTNALKTQQIKAYGYADTNLADYEEDHLIPLELGGHPTDPKNLWPEPRSGSYPASKKDGVENSLRTNVCAGLLTLAAAQAAIATNWESVP